MLTGTLSSLVLDNHLDIAWQILLSLFDQLPAILMLDLLPFDQLKS